MSTKSGQGHDETQSCKESEADVICCYDLPDCSCEQAVCEMTADGCECKEWRLGTAPVGTLVEACEAPAGGHCCSYGGYCGCGPEECSELEAEVASCAKRDVGCYRGDRVADCADPEGGSDDDGPSPDGPSGDGFEGCAAFRQTGECGADGPRQPCSDHACTDEIPTDVSGFCECGQGRVDLDCGHEVISCEASCGTFTPTESCVAWRHTGDYSADGPRQPENDRACNSWIATDWSGFCECADGDVPFDSYHAPFSCATVCAGLPVDPAVCEPANTSAGEGGGCSGNSDCGDCERCELSTGNCVPRLDC